MKRLLFFFILLLTAIDSQSQNFEAGGVYYNITSVEKLTVAVAYSKSMYFGTVVIPENVTHDGVTYSVTAISDYAFYYCRELVSVSIPNTVVTIGEGAFSISSLPSITIPNSVTSIGKGAFEGCDELTSVTISSNVTIIDSYVFAGCGFTSIIIPDGVTTVGSFAFSGCSALKDVYCLAESVPNTDADSFNGVKLSSATLHAPTVSLQDYSTTEPWSKFNQIVAIDEGDCIERLASEESNSFFTNPTVYDLSGRRTTKMQKGLNLLRNVDGQVRKVLQK